MCRFTHSCKQNKNWSDVFGYAAVIGTTNTDTTCFCKCVNLSEYRSFSLRASAQNNAQYRESSCASPVVHNQVLPKDSAEPTRATLLHVRFLYPGPNIRGLELLGLDDVRWHFAQDVRVQSPFNLLRKSSTAHLLAFGV